MVSKIPPRLRSILIKGYIGSENYNLVQGETKEILITDALEQFKREIICKWGSEYLYHVAWAKKRGFRNLYEYQKYLGERQGFKNFYQLVKYNKLKKERKISKYIIIDGMVFNNEKREYLKYKKRKIKRDKILNKHINLLRRLRNNSFKE